MYEDAFMLLIEKIKLFW